MKGHYEKIMVVKLRAYHLGKGPQRGVVLERRTQLWKHMKVQKRNDHNGM